MGSGFDNPLSAGEVLILPSLHSPNYVPDVSGWTINEDGSAEFNDLTVRGTIIIEGSNAILVYSGVPALGNLVASLSGDPGVDPFGNPYSAGLQFLMGFAQAIHWLDPSAALNTPALSADFSGPGGTGVMQITGPEKLGSTLHQFLQFFSGAAVNAGSTVLSAAADMIVKAGGAVLLHMTTTQAILQGGTSVLILDNSAIELTGQGDVNLTNQGNVALTNPGTLQLRPNGPIGEYLAFNYQLAANQAGSAAANTFQTITSWTALAIHTFSDYVNPMTASGVFTAPVSGYYWVTLRVVYTTATVGQYGLRILQSGITDMAQAQRDYSLATAVVDLSALVFFTVNGAYTFQASTPVGGKTILGNNLPSGTTLTIARML